MWCYSDIHWIYDYRAPVATHARTYAYGFLIMEPAGLLKLLEKTVVILVRQRVGVISRREVYTYVTKYGEFTVVTRSETLLPLSSSTEIIEAKKLLLPSPVAATLEPQ